MKDWSIRAAKDHLSELVDAAQTAPQAITRRGRCMAVVLSRQEFERLRGRREPLSAFFARSGLDQIDLERVQASVRDEGEL
jgi:prevent-host-death family protein